jgi:hypothetical protein
MKAPQRSLISVAIALALASGSAHAALERLGPISNAPSIGGFPTWFQDSTGIALEFCDPKNVSEVEGGWCLLLPGDPPTVPEVFPTSFFDEHFYYAGESAIDDATPPGGLSALVVTAIESAFAAGVEQGQQVVFGRLRVRIRSLPWNGDYRVITPYSDVTYQNLPAGERLFETSDIGIECGNAFECALNSYVGPFLLPSPTPGGAEVPPIPDLAAAPRGTDPFYDLLGTGITPYPGTGKKYIADPSRSGPVTGSPLPPFTAYNVGGGSTTKNHNIFRIEVRPPNSSGLDVAPFYVIENSNFSLMGRLMGGPIPGKVTVDRASYKADSAGQVTALDVFATASPTTQSRLPAQPQVAAVMPILSYVQAPCGGALTTDAAGNVTVNLPPYTAPAGAEHSMASTTTDFWGQSQPSVLPSYVCVKDATSRNSAGQVAPSYYLKKVTDAVTITQASFDAGALKVNAVSSDPTALLTLAGYGPAPSATPGVSLGKGSGTGLALAGNAAAVSGLQAPPSRAQVSSSKGGSDRMKVDTGAGVAAPASGVPAAVNDSGTLYEDCSAAAASFCADGQGYTHDLLANDTVVINGDVKTVRSVVAGNLAAVTVDALAPRLGVASIVNGYLTYTPNPNAFGTDSITYTVTVDGKSSNPAMVTIDITPVNDAPVAANAAAGAVLSRASSLSLIANGTDPDGSADLKGGVIVTWPAQLGVRPTPVNGVISFTPNTAGNFSFTYQVKDAAGVVSNTATTSVTVQASEAIAITKSRFTGGGNVGGATSARWTVTGTDTILQGQTLSIVYNNGRLRNQLTACNGTATIPGCVIDTVVVDAAGAYAYDKIRSPGGAADPTDTNTWVTRPTSIKVFSSSPVLGGSATRAIEFK